nr:GNAT family N-acetyltransferase [Gemmatimonadaceae bacterium]
PAFTIRRGVVADAPALAVFAAQTFRDTYEADNAPGLVDAHVAAAFGEVQQAAELSDPSRVTLLALHDDALAGYAQLRVGAAPPCVVQPAVVELQRFYVARAFHGRGLAAPLLSAAFDAARTMGGRHVWLGVWERNPRAITFYRRQGFALAGTHTFMMGPDAQRDHVLVRALTDPPPA